MARKFTQEQEQEIKRLYEDGVSALRIVDHAHGRWGIQTTHVTIRNVLSRQGARIRTPSERNLIRARQSAPGLTNQERAARLLGLKQRLGRMQVRLPTMQQILREMEEIVEALRR